MKYSNISIVLTLSLVTGILLAGCGLRPSA